MPQLLLNDKLWLKETANQDASAQCGCRERKGQLEKAGAVIPG